MQRFHHYSGDILQTLNTGVEAGTVVKRITDIVLSTFGLIVLSPLLLLMAVLIKTTSKGPIIYRQERIGPDGRRFKLLKFRSMRIDAESMPQAIWCRPTDNRRTTLGTFMKRTTLDELPQLWNVLCGDTSLVESRPERPRFAGQFRKDISRYRAPT